MKIRGGVDPHLGLWVPGGLSSNPSGEVNLRAYSDLVAWYDFTDASTLFTDTARTTPVANDGDAIAGVTDKGPNGWHLNQATGSLCPLYKTGIIGPQPVARFDNVDDYLETVSADPTTPFSEVTVVAVFTRLDVVAYHAIADFTAGTNNRLAVWGSTATGNNAAIDTGTGAGRVFTTWDNPGAGPLIMIADASSTNDVIHIYGDGPLVKTQNTATSILDSGAGVHYTVGNNAGHAVPLGADLAMLALFAHVLSDVERNTIGYGLARTFQLPWSP